jgi:hypothetical protein
MTALAKIEPEQIIAFNGSQSLHDRAVFVYDRLKTITTRAASDFIEAGLLLNEAEELALWSHMENPSTGEYFQNMGEFAEEVLSYGRATYMEAKRVVREFAHIPLEDLKTIQRVNFKILRKLPESKQIQPKWIAAAGGPEKEFLTQVNAELGLHLENRQKLIFSFWESELRVVDSALDHKLTELKEDDPKATKEDALAMICADWMEANGYEVEKNEVCE